VKACTPAGTPEEIASLPLERQLEHATICHELDLAAWEGCAARQQQAAAALRDVAARCVVKARPPE